MDDANAYCTMKQEFFSVADMVPVKLIISILQSNVVQSQDSEQNCNLTICKTKFRKNICLKITGPDERLLEYGE